MEAGLSRHREFPVSLPQEQQLQSTILPCTAPLGLLHPAQERASLQGFAVMLGGSVKAQHVMPDPRAAF